MESWAKGRTDLLDEITKICNRIGNDISCGTLPPLERQAAFTDTPPVELDAENLYSTLVGKGELKVLREKGKRVEELERENRRLAGELERALQQQRRTDTPIRDGPGLRSSATPAPISSGTNDEQVNPRERHRSLVEKYNKLSQSFLDMKAAKEKVDGLLRERNKTLAEWKEWERKQQRLVEKKDARLRKVEEELRSFRGRFGVAGVPSSGFASGKETSARDQYGDVPPFREVEEREHSALQARQHERLLCRLETSGRERSGQDTDELLLDNPDLPNPHASIEEGNQVEPIDSHDTSSTREDSSPIAARNPDAGDVEVKDEPSSSLMIVSSRRVNKRKRHDSQEHTPVSKVKREEVDFIANSPLGLAGFDHLNDSIDLDDIGEKQDTPRKQRPNTQLSRHHVSAARHSLHSLDLTQDRSNRTVTNPPAGHRSSQITPSRRVDTVLQPRSTNPKVLPRTSAEKERAPKKRRVAKSIDIAGVTEDGELDARGRQCRHSSEPSDRLSDLLEKPSLQRVAITSPAAHINRRKRVPSGLAREVRASDDDEEAELSPPWPRQILHSETPSRPSSRGTTSKSGQTSRPTSKGSSRSSVEPPRPTFKGSRGSLDKPQPQSGLLEYAKWKRTPIESEHFSKPSPRSGLKAIPKLSARQSRSAKTSPPHWRKVVSEDMDVDPDKAPLRSLPLENLTIQDFKINPDYNQGYNYAFSEVVRGIEARKCLQGCIKPECCGKQFRVLAEMSRNNRINPIPEQLAEDQKLMEKHLGDNAYKLRNMRKDEKWEILMQALTRDMSNKYGNHRQAYERKASPPGFWRTDFPTTQENEEDRRRAKEKDRATVEERYMEAMRPGGAYLFRDE